MASLTAAAQSVALRVHNRDTDVAVALSGTYAATVLLQREHGSVGSGSWETLKTYNTANATVADTYKTKRDGESLRLYASAYTSGTVVATITENNRDVNTGTITDGHGKAILTPHEKGVRINGSIRNSGPVGAGSTLTVDPDTHAMRTILLDTAAGSTVTLPAATGTGDRYRFVISVKATTNSHIVKVANSTDIIQGILQTMSDDPVTMKGFAAGATDDTITLNRTTTGSVNVGEYIEIEDVASGVFNVRGVTSSTGTEATPFSSTV